MRVGVIGLGSIGRRHVGNLLRLGCDVWVYDISVAAFSDTTGEWVGLQMLLPGLIGHMDALVIATPYDTHLQWVENALKHNKPFFVEKSLGSLEQLPRWREIAAMDLPVNQVGYQCRFHPKAQAMKQLFPNASHGSIVCEVDMATWPGTYGPFLLEASHDIDMGLFLGAEGEPHVRPWSHGKSVEFSMGEWEFSFSDGKPYRRQWEVGVPFDRGAQVTFRAPDEIGDEVYRAEMRHFLDCVRDGRPTSVPLADGLRVLEVVAQVEALCRSSV